MSQKKTMLLFQDTIISLLFYFLFAAALSIILVILPSVLSPFTFNQWHEKISAYECGFEPFSDVRDTFDIHFILVAILFIIFDLELMLIFPWAMGLMVLNMFGIWSMTFFLFLLTIGFIYEWSRGALVWPIFIK